MIRWGWSEPPRHPGLAAAVSLGRWRPVGPLLSLPYVVFDTETTGFHPFAGDEIIAIAGRNLWDGKEFDSLVNPGRSIPRESTDLTGISDEDVADAPDAVTVLEGFFRFAGASVLVAHCADFDRAFVEAKLKSAARVRWVHPLLDTMALAQGLFPSWGDYRLEHCATMLQTSVEGRHTALGDTRTTCRIARVLIEESLRRGLETWQDLVLFQHHRNVW